MRKNQLENLVIGNKIKGYSSDEIFTVVAIPDTKELRYVLKSEDNLKTLSASSLQKNFILLEEEPAKVEIIESTQGTIQEIAITEVVEVKEPETKLTKMEIEFLNGMRNNNFSDIWDSKGEFVFAVLEVLPYPEQQAAGVMSSLIKKDMIEVEDGDEHNMVSFTDKGRVLFHNSTGEECSWGGPNLLEVPVTPDRDEEIKTKVRGALARRKKATKVEPEGEIVTSADLADGLGITPQDLRRILRKNGFIKPVEGWRWNPQSEEYKSILSVVKGVKEKRDAKRK